MFNQAKRRMLPLVVDAVTFTINGKKIIDDVSLAVSNAGKTILLGPNGAGKSTLLKLCHGLLPLTAGSIHWGNLTRREAAKHQAMVFQRPVLLRRAAAQNIDHALKIRRLPARERRALVAESLQWAGLTDLATTSAPDLSGGEQQSLSIARAWALNSDVLLLDEPTANLDPGATRRVEALIRSFAESGRKVIMTTHNIHQAQRLADDVLFVNHGRLLEHSPAGRFFSQPTNSVAAQFISGELLD